MNDEEFDAFYAATSARLVGQLVMMIGDRAEAQDCVQEAFVRAWNHRLSLHRDGNPEAWVRTTARRLAVSRWRRTTAGLRAHIRHGPPPPPAEPAPDHVALMAALATLPAPMREAIVLHHLCDLSLQQVAAECGAPSAPSRPGCPAAGRPWPACWLPNWPTKERPAMPEDRLPDLGRLLREASASAGADSRLDPAAMIRGRAERRRRIQIGASAAAVAVVTAVAVGVGSQLVGNQSIAPVAPVTFSTASPAPGSRPPTTAPGTTPPSTGTSADPTTVDPSTTTDPVGSVPGTGSVPTSQRPDESTGLLLPHDLTDETGWTALDGDTWVSDPCFTAAPYPSDADRVDWRSEAQVGGEGGSGRYQQVATYPDEAAAQQAVVELRDRVAGCPTYEWNVDSREVYAAAAPGAPEDPAGDYLRLTGHYESDTFPGLGGSLLLIRQEGATVLLLGSNDEHADYTGASGVDAATDTLLNDEVLPWVAATG